MTFSESILGRGDRPHWRRTLPVFVPHASWDPQTRAEYQRLVTEIASGTYTGQQFEPRAETPASSEPGGCSGCPGDPYA